MENFKFKTGDNSKNLGSLEDSIHLLELVLIGSFYFLVLPIISQSFFVMRLSNIYLFIALALVPLSLIIYITLAMIKLKLKSDKGLYFRLKREIMIFAYSTGVLSFLIATIFLNDLDGENIATLILLDIFVLNTISFIFYLEKHRVYLNNTESDHKFDYSTSLIIIIAIFYILLLIFGSYEPSSPLMSGLNQTHNYVFHVLAMLSGVFFILVPLVLFYRDEYHTIGIGARRDKSDEVMDYIHKTIGEIKDESLIPDKFQKNKENEGNEGNEENDKNKMDLQGPKSLQIRKYLLYPLKIIYYLFNSVVLILLATGFFYYELIYGQDLFFFAFLNASVSFFIYSLLSGLSKSRKNSDILENRKIMSASVIKRIFYDVAQIIIPIIFIIMALTDDAFTENILLCSLVGVVFGVSFGRFYFSGAIRPHISKNKLRKKLIGRAFHLFWLNILIIGASFLATLIPYLINPTPDVLSISLVSSIISNKTAFLTNSNITLYVVAIILVILFIGELYSNDRLRGLNHNLKNVIIKTSDFLKKIKNRKTSIFGQRNDGLSIMNFDRRIIVYTLILLFLMPSLMLFMVNKAHFSV
ncbi:MAG: hypothetical protein ACTSU2_03530, partial [Promethearchaeota archaeon]